MEKSRKIVSSAAILLIKTFRQKKITKKQKLDENIKKNRCEKYFHFMDVRGRGGAIIRNNTRDPAAEQ